MDNLKQFATMEDPKDFLSKRNASKEAYNKEIKDIQEKIKTEADKNNQKVLYSISIVDLMFFSEHDRKAYLDSTYSNHGTFQLHKFDVTYYEALHQYGTAFNSFYFEFYMHEMEGTISNMKVKKENARFAEIPYDELQFFDEEMKIAYWRTSVFFLTKEEYLKCKELINQIYQKLGLRFKN